MPHLRALDGLRGLAILAVLAYHSGLLSGGFVGVDLFFALSGYLITTLLLQERERFGDIALRAFWARRALRLVPALVAAVGLAVLVSRWIGMPLEGTWIAATLLYGSNLLIGYGHVYPIGMLSHTWSLGMEEQFYLLWPPIVALACRWGPRGVFGAATLLTIGPALARSGYAAAHPGNPYADPTLWTRLYFAPEMRFDAIAVGCWAAAAAALGPFPGRARDVAIGIAALAGAVWLGAVCLYADIGALVARPMLFSATAWAAIAVVVAAIRAPFVARPLSWAPLVGLGKISYGLYLYHPIVFLGLSSSPIWVCWAVAIGLATASFWLWERLFLRLKGRYVRA